MILCRLQPLSTSLTSQKHCPIALMKPGATTGLESIVLHGQAHMFGLIPTIDAKGCNCSNWLTLAHDHELIKLLTLQSI